MNARLLGRNGFEVSETFAGHPFETGLSLRRAFSGTSFPNP
jgi:hypothetical protein